MFRFVHFVNENRQFINIKFCSALFSVCLLLSLFLFSLCERFFFSLNHSLSSHTTYDCCMYIIYPWYVKTRASSNKRTQIVLQNMLKEKKMTPSHNWDTLKWKETKRERKNQIEEISVQKENRRNCENMFNQMLSCIIFTCSVIRPFCHSRHRFTCIFYHKQYWLRIR